MYVDSHAHLEGTKFDADRAEVLARAKSAGVDDVLLIGNGTGPGTWDCALRVVKAFAAGAASPRLHATLGIHPHEASAANPDAYAALEQLARDPHMVAWGEIGLDYYYDHSPRDVQARVFRDQMELAAAAKLPIIIHCRPSDNSTNAWDDTIAMLGEHWVPRGLGGILHCFTGEPAHARAALDMGFHVSFAGNVTFPKAESIRASARLVPLDRMLIETDSPYLAPVPYRGKRNEPAFVVQTAAYIAQLRDVAPEEIGQATAANFRRLLSLRAA